MNLYHVMVELRDGAHALSFAHAAETWFNGLKSRGLIASWTIHRRKLGLASGRHTDFLIQIETDTLTALDGAFAALAAEAGADLETVYSRMHDMIGSAEVGLYRPYPDESQRERVALI